MRYALITTAVVTLPGCEFLQDVGESVGAVAVEAGTRTVEAAASGEITSVSELVSYGLGAVLTAVLAEVTRRKVKARKEERANGARDLIERGP